jgi:hypothetical protein
LRNKTIEWIEKQKYTDLNLNQETKKNMKRERERERERVSYASREREQEIYEKMEQQSERAQSCV